MPSVAERELNHNFTRVINVLWTRGYARAKRAYDDLDSLSPQGRAALLQQPLVRLVRDTEFEMAEADVAERTDDDG